MELSETHRKPAVQSARWSSWEELKLRYDSSVILGYDTEFITEGIISLNVSTVYLFSSAIITSYSDYSWWAEIQTLQHNQIKADF